MVSIVLRYAVICSTAAASWPSIEMIEPRVAKGGDAGLGFASGGEILDRMRILLNIGMDMIMASTDLACADSPDGVVFCKGGKVREESGGCAMGNGRGGGPIAKVGEFIKSGRGRDSRRRGKAKGVAGPFANLGAGT